LGALYNVFFVYGKADGRVLLGKSPFFGFYGELEEDRKKVDHVRNIILGWLPGSRVCEWNTREGFQWDRGSTLAGAPGRRTWPGRIYRDPELAKKAADARSLDEYLKVPFLFTEKFDEKGESPEVAYDAPRFPILEEAAAEEHMRGGRLLKVGGVGGLGTALTKEQIDAVQSELARWQEVEGTIEILFVIDET